MAESFEIEPGVGMGPVRLGMRRSEVVMALGEPEREHPDWLGVGMELYWFGASFSASLDGEGTVGALEMNRGGAVVAVFRGVDVLAAPASEAIDVFESSVGPGEYRENCYSFEFHNVRLWLWRQSLPGDSDIDDPQFRGGLHWDSVCISLDSYDAEVEAAAAARRKMGQR